MAYFDTPGGKMEVSSEAVELMLKHGVPCKKVEKPNPYIDKGYEYYWYKNDNGKMVTRIRPLNRKEEES